MAALLPALRVIFERKKRSASAKCTVADGIHSEVKITRRNQENKRIQEEAEKSTLELIDLPEGAFDAAMLDTEVKFSGYVKEDAKRRRVDPEVFKLNGDMAKTKECLITASLQRISLRLKVNGI